MVFTFSTKGFEIQMWCVFKERSKMILERVVLITTNTTENGWEMWKFFIGTLNILSVDVRQKLVIELGKKLNKANICVCGGSGLSELYRNRKWWKYHWLLQSNNIYLKEMVCGLDCCGDDFIWTSSIVACLLAVAISYQRVWLHLRYSICIVQI